MKLRFFVNSKALFMHTTKVYTYIKRSQACFQNEYVDFKILISNVSLDFLH